MDDPLVPASPEGKRDILFRFDVRTVHHHVHQVSHWRVRHTFQTVSRVEPDILFRKESAYPFQERKQSSLILRLHGIASEYGKALNPRGTQGLDDFLFGFPDERLTVAEIPSLFIKTVFAPVTATAYKKLNTNPRAVCNIKFFNYCIIHK